MNAGLMLGNIGALAAFMSTNEATLGMSMLGATSSLSAVMGVTLTMAIGGKLLTFDSFILSFIANTTAGRFSNIGMHR